MSMTRDRGMVCFRSEVLGSAVDRRSRLAGQGLGMKVSQRKDGIKMSCRISCD